MVNDSYLEGLQVELEVAHKLNDQLIHRTGNKYFFGKNQKNKYNCDIVLGDYEDHVRVPLVIECERVKNLKDFTNIKKVMEYRNRGGVSFLERKANMKKYRKWEDDFPRAEMYYLITTFNPHDDAVMVDMAHLIENGIKVGGPPTKTDNAEFKDNKHTTYKVLPMYDDHLIWGWNKIWEEISENFAI